MAELLFYLALIYLLIGFVFGLYFVAIGAKRRDPAAVSNSIGVKLILLPGSVALWPILLACKPEAISELPPQETE